MPHLFDPQPKDDPRVLYGRDKELAELVGHIKQKRWVVLLGPRRIGKTSLARCAAKALGYRCVVADAREESDLTRVLLSALMVTTAVTKQSGVRASLGLQIPQLPLSIDVEYSHVSKSALTSTLDRLLERKKGQRLVILLDEAQWFRNPRGVVNLLAHVYDYHYESATLVITGSAVGVMRSITEPDAKSALFGRALTTMEVERWSPSVSLAFLREGCKEQKLPYNERQMSGVVDEIDGIPGWLTLFGYHYSAIETNTTSARMESALRKTRNEGMKILKGELENVSRIAAGWKRQMNLLKALTAGGKRFTELVESSGLPNAVLARHLTMLQKLRYVERDREEKYVIIDPLLRDFLISQAR
jgi:AAA+ ATPase superfamily predicted ATPase